MSQRPAQRFDLGATFRMGFLCKTHTRLAVRLSASLRRNRVYYRATRAIFSAPAPRIRMKFGPTTGNHFKTLCRDERKSRNAVKATFGGTSGKFYGRKISSYNVCRRSVFVTVTFVFILRFGRPSRDRIRQYRV